MDVLANPIVELSRVTIDKKERNLKNELEQLKTTAEQIPCLTKMIPCLTLCKIINEIVYD
jgi:hypothetical protein